MNEIMSSQETVAILVVDATNAFNIINRQAALHNIGVIWPAISTMLNNTYQTPVKFFFTGGGVVQDPKELPWGIPWLWPCTLLQ